FISVAFATPFASSFSKSDESIDRRFTASVTCSGGTAFAISVYSLSDLVESGRLTVFCNPRELFFRRRAYVHTPTHVVFISVGGKCADHVSYLVPLRSSLNARLPPPHNGASQLNEEAHSKHKGILFAVQRRLVRMRVRVYLF